MKNIVLRYILAVIASLATVIILSIGTDALLQAINVFPPLEQENLYAGWMLALALVYRSLYGVLGGYVAAALAPAKPIRLAVILGIIGTVVNLAAAVARWDFGHHWYPIGLAVTSLPTTWLGAKWRLAKKVAVQPVKTFA